MRPLPRSIAALAGLLVLLSLPPTSPGLLHAQSLDTLTVLRAGDGVTVRLAYADIYTVRQSRTTGLAQIVYGAGANQTLASAETLESIVARSACKLLPFTRHLSGDQQALSYAAIDSVRYVPGGAGGGGVIYSRSEALGVAPITYYTTTPGGEVYARYYNCGTVTALDPLIGAEAVGYGESPLYDRSGRLLRLRSLTGINGIQVRAEGGTLILDGAGGGTTGSGSGGTAGTSQLAIEQGTSSASFGLAGQSGLQLRYLLAASPSRAGLLLPADYEKLRDLPLAAQLPTQRSGAELVTVLDDQIGSPAWRGGDTASGPGGGSADFAAVLVQGEASLQVAGRTASAATTAAAGGGAGAGGGVDLTGQPSTGYDLVIAAGTVVDRLTFTGQSTTANSQGDLILRIDNSAGGTARLFTVEFYTLSTGERIDMPARGMVVRQTVTEGRTTLSVTGVGGNFSRGYYTLLR